MKKNKRRSRKKEKWKYVWDNVFVQYIGGGYRVILEFADFAVNTHAHTHTHTSVIMMLDTISYHNSRKSYAYNTQKKAIHKRIVSWDWVNLLLLNINEYLSMQCWDNSIGN